MSEDKIQIEYFKTGNKKDKIKKISHKDYEFFFWNYEEQTKIKHFVFESYFNVFVKMLGKYNELNYIDGFGGCGTYYDLNDNKVYYGSPIRAGEVVNSNLNRNVQLVIIEQELENIENLKKVFNHKNLLSLKPIFIEGDFDTKINEILDKTNCKLCPTFFLVDPFGFKIKYSTLKRIMSVDKSEIFLNFMFNSVQRFLTASDMETNMNELFGCKEWKNIASKNDREYEIINLFKNQLKNFSKFVFPYRLPFPSKKMTYYYMFHLTNHIKGCSIMKDCFAKFNNGKVEYFGDTKPQGALFNIDEYKYGELEKYSAQKLNFEKILEENIDCTEYLEKEFKEVIKRLKNKNKIKLIPIPAKTTTGREKTKIDYTDIIDFCVI